MDTIAIVGLGDVNGGALYIQTHPVHPGIHLIVFRQLRNSRQRTEPGVRRRRAITPEKRASLADQLLGAHNLGDLRKIALERPIQRPVDRVVLVVGCLGRGVRPGRVDDLDDRAAGLLHAWVYARAHAGEQRDAQRGTLVDVDGDVVVTASHPPESAARQSLLAPPPDALTWVIGNAHLLEYPERIPQAVGNSFEDRSHEMRPVAPQGDSEEHAARVGIRIRRALAGEIRQEDQPLAARRGLRGLLAHNVVRVASHRLRNSGFGAGECVAIPPQSSRPPRA